MLIFQITAPVAQLPYPGSWEALKIAFTRRSIPDVALDLMLACFQKH